MQNKVKKKERMKKDLREVPIVFRHYLSTLGNSQHDVDDFHDRGLLSSTLV